MVTEDNVIAGLYRAAQGEIEWRSALEPVTKLTGCWVVQLMGVDLQNGRITYSYEGGDGAPEAIVDYVRRYHTLDPHLQYLMPLAPGHWYHSNDYFDDAAVAAHPFYQEFLIPYGDRYVSGMKVDQDETTAVVLGVHRAMGTTPLGLAGRAQVERLGFHFQQAVRLWRRHRQTLGEAALGRELLDRMGTAVLLVDEQRRIAVANKLAQRTLRLSPLREVNLHLTCSDTEADHEITLALRQLQLGGRMGLDGRAATDKAFVQIHQPGRLPLSLCLLAIRPESTMGAFGGRAMAMILVHDPSKRPELDPFMVASAYDLSPAEARVAVALAVGRLPKQIAVAHNVAVATVRSQIRSVFQKLGVNTIGALATMLNTAPFAALQGDQ